MKKILIQKTSKIQLIIYVFAFLSLFLFQINSNSYPKELIIPQVTIEKPAINDNSKIYYISTKGNNKNKGTKEKPFLTIQYACDLAEPGTKIIVESGKYNERIKINRSGKKGKYIVLESKKLAEVKGFLINGNYIAVTGFNITGDDSYRMWLGGGFWINGKNIYLSGNKISGFTSCPAIVSAWGKDVLNENIYIKDNYIYKCNMGIIVKGKNWIVEGNEIERLFHGPNGIDADYFRLFGENLIIRNNIMHGTLKSEIGKSHTDLFQSFDNNGDILKNVLIEKNIGLGYFAQGGFIEGNPEYKNIIFYRNVFAGGTSWGIAVGGADGVHIYNNNIININIHGIGFLVRKNNGAKGSVINNIIAFTNSSYWAKKGAGYISSNNLIYKCTGKPVPGSNTDLFNVNPGFFITDFTNITIDDLLGPDGKSFTNDDGFMLKKNSPLLKAGTTGCNIGAY